MELRPVPLTKEGFAPFGDVIEAIGSTGYTMNDGRFFHFPTLAGIVAEPNGVPVISIVESGEPTTLPVDVSMVERHQLGSQAFIPLSFFSFVVVVHTPGQTVEASGLKAFVTNGQQGINYHPGTWHMPLIATETGQRFLVVDRDSEETDCDLFPLPTPVRLQSLNPVVD